MSMTAEQITQSHSDAKGYWEVWQTTWEDLSELILPSHRGFNSEWYPGQRRQRRQFDGMAMNFNVKLANNMHTLLTNPATTWNTWRFGDEELRESDAAREWLEECHKLAMAAMKDSNFDIEINEMYLELCALGMGCLHCEAKLPKYGQDDNEFHGLWFKAYSMSEITSAENGEGLLDTSYRELELTAQQAVEMFGEVDMGDVRKGVPKSVGESYKNGKLLQKDEYTHVIYPRRLDKEPTYPALPDDRPYASVYVHKGSKQICYEEGLYENARYLPRWQGRADDWGGYGPGERAFPDVRTVNTGARIQLNAAAKLLDPPIAMKANNMIGDLHMGPQSITYFRDLNGVKEWDVKPDVRQSMDVLARNDQHIRDAFLIDDLDLPRREDIGEMTMYETAKRIEQAYQNLGPTLGRLQRELLHPLLQRVFSIMARRGALPEPPQEVIAAGGAAKIDIEYNSPLANAQRMEEIASADGWLSRLERAALSQTNAGLVPDIMDNVDWDAYARISGENSGVPETIIKNKGQVARERRERAMAQAEQAQIDQAAQVAGAAKDLGAGNSAGLDVVKAAA